MNINHSNNNISLEGESLCNIIVNVSLRKIFLGLVKAWYRGEFMFGDFVNFGQVSRIKFILLLSVFDLNVGL